MLLTLTSLTFAIWTFLMFRTLFAQRRRSVARTGRSFPTLGDTLLEWRHWLTAPEHARDRWQLLITTLVLFALIALNATQLPTQSNLKIPS
ncbi:MAG: hypothetical protein WA790_20715 [Sulfitobacter sp.]